MALIKCPECGKDVSDSASTCPHCGYGLKSHFRKEQISEKKEQTAKVIIDSAKEASAKAVSVFSNKKCRLLFLISISLLAVIVAISLAFQKPKAIHNVRWEMSLSQVKKVEKRRGSPEGVISTQGGWYSAPDNTATIYSIDDSEYYGADVEIQYVFEDDKLTSVWCFVRGLGFIDDNYKVEESSDYYKAYNAALSICKENGLPTAFFDLTDDTDNPRSSLVWKTGTSTISLNGEYSSSWPSYYFIISPNEEDEGGGKYVYKGKCSYGSATSNPCPNEIAPWNEDGHCFAHGCFVMGCPYGLENFNDKVPACSKHHFLYW